MSDFDVSAFHHEFPFRPDHPDFERLRTVVDKMEGWKAAGVDPKTVYGAIVDILSMSYLAVNRAGMNMPPDGAGPNAVLEIAANAWSEGFAYGVLFQQAGGTRMAADDDRG